MKCTPCKIVEQKDFFSIPIYQRLFEWDNDNIVTLLDDLNKSFSLSNGNDDYYVGMLTSTIDKELVDGQQRFTVIMLMGCVFQNYDERWKEFLLDDIVRLHFSSRPLDDAYMRSLIDNAPLDNALIVNKKMQNAIKTIQQYMGNGDKVKNPTAFAAYVFEHLCFFVTELPKGYSPSDLNKYFERMNTTGRNLEQHEILKVKLLSNFTDDVDKYMSIWNKLADVDTLLIRKREYESEDALRQRKQTAFLMNIEDILNSNVINGLASEDLTDGNTIMSIPLSEDKPKSERESNSESHCALTFPYLLLQVLYRYVGGKIEGNIDDFFKPSNLLDTFSKHLPYDASKANAENIRSFMDLLLKGRLALDICFIRPSEFGYILDMNQNDDSEELKTLMMYQSMLFVSSSNYTNYRWFGWLMDGLEFNKYQILTAKDFFNHFKSCDEKLNHTIPEYDKLSFNNDVRYWFWKLDFYIWQHRKELFKDSPEALTVAENYIFRRNRSIEHIAPQTPQSNSMMKWDDTPEDAKLRDSFGNLVMISQGLNSVLSNESYEVKTAHVQSFYNGAKSGSVESLKLLTVHQKYSKWDRETIKEHGENMYEMLKKLYNNQTI